MVFSSLLFLFRFLPAVLILYFLAPRRWRNLVLLLFSLAFYAWGEPVYIILDARSRSWSLIPGGILVDRFLRQGRSRLARVALIGSSVVSLSLLGFFKYADFVIGTVNSLTGSELGLLKLALPIGISFYTFQTMSYTIDVYRGEAKVQKNRHLLRSLRHDVSAADRRSDRAATRTIAEQLRTAEGDGGAVRRGRSALYASVLAKKCCWRTMPGALWDSIRAMTCTELRSADRHGWALAALYVSALF